jgi:hypothetical protein
MVIISHIDKWDVTRVLVDNGSQAEILFLSNFEQMVFSKKQLKEASKPLYGFQCSHWVHNLRCGGHELYLQCLFWRGLLNTFEVALHSLYLCLKVPVALGAITIHGNYKDARNIEQGFTPGHRNVNCLQDEKAENGNNTAKRMNKGTFTSRPIKPEWETRKVPLDPRVPDQAVMISQDLSPNEEAKLFSFLDGNSDAFAWQTSNLMGASKDIIEHKLQVNPTTRPMKQKLHKMSYEKVAVVKAGFIHEVLYPSWLVNVVMVKKKNIKWRMWANFTDLNKSCPKDDFPFSRMDEVVDSAAGCETMELLDCFLGYHQIWLRKEDEEKTSFITPFGTYYYLSMPERLTNAGPTFCRMTKAILKDQMQRNIFTYVNDIVVASRKKATQIQDLAENFTNMRRAQLKLNPEKCVFGVRKGKVLGCLVLVKGIKAILDKISAVGRMKPPLSRKKGPRLFHGKTSRAKLAIL